MTWGMHWRPSAPCAGSWKPITCRNRERHRRRHIDFFCRHAVAMQTLATRRSKAAATTRSGTAWRTWGHSGSATGCRLGHGTASTAPSWSASLTCSDKVTLKTHVAASCAWRALARPRFRRRPATGGSHTALRSHRSAFQKQRVAVMDGEGRRCCSVDDATILPVSDDS